MFVLPEPVGPGDQHHSVGPENGALEFRQGLRLEPELGHIQAQVFLVEQPHDNFFAEQGGHG